MATMIASAAVAFKLERFTPLSVGQKGRVGGRISAAAARASLSPNSQSSSPRPLLSLDSLFQDAPKFDGARNWTWRIADTDLGKVLTPIAASAGFYLQDSASGLEEVVKVEDSQLELIVILATSGFYAILYFLVIPAIIYNYLRLRWYKRKAAETFFQFMLVFIFFPGMLLLAPFINFRRLPKDGTEPP